MKGLAVSVLLYVSLLAQASAATTSYLCTSDRGINWDSPMLADDPVSKSMLALARQFVFDSATATFRLVSQPDGALLDPLQFRILKEGNASDSDLVAENPAEHSLLRIRTWQKSMRFFLFESLMIYAGNCEPLKASRK